MKMKQLFLAFVSLLISYGLVMAEYSIKVTQPTADCNGSIIVTTNGNIGPYTFLWTDSSGIPEPSNDTSTSSEIIEVCTGNYTVTITNGFGCTTSIDANFNTIDVAIKVRLEGAYDTDSLRMLTKLHHERRLLPGQTPISGLAVPTLEGKLYWEEPFNHDGTEGAGWTDANYAEYGSVVDWVLVSLRSDFKVDSTLDTKAALLLKDGTVRFPHAFELAKFPDSVHIVVEHRNHLPIISPLVPLVNNSKYEFDFVENNSLKRGGAGQKPFEAMINPPKIDTLFWYMYAGNAELAAGGDVYDIKGNDKEAWSKSNGQFDRYSTADLNLDGEVKGDDKGVWQKNNGVFGTRLDQ